MPIRQLPDTLINQIAAGEVVERPASVVKELVENALDAGANRVDIDLEEGGAKLIRIRDDGVGIDPAEMPLALSRHATSKIASLDDLEAVATLGFRGEALPSIASVSRFRLVSRRRDEAHGACLQVNGGKAEPVVPHPHPPGTTVEVRDLFHNVPARRKFLRAERTELNHIEEWLRSLALARPDIDLRVSHNGKPVRRYRPDPAHPEQRMLEALGEEFFTHALRVAHEASGLRLHGWIALPGYTRSTGQQYLYVNGRCVRDRNMAHAIKQGYQDVLFHGRYPACVLFLEVDPRRVDVNVHPAKHEVRFRDARLIHDFILRTLHEALREVRAEAEQAWRGTDNPGMAPMAGMPVSATGAGWQPPSAQRIAEVRAGYQALYAGRSTAPAASQATDGIPALGYAIAQLHGRYILAENAAGLIVVDTRQARRQLFLERLQQAAASADGIRTVPLLVPDSVPLDANQQAAVERHASALQQWGLDWAPDGRGRLQVRGLPAMAHGLPGEAWVAALLARLPDTDEGGLPALLAETMADLPQARLTLVEMNAMLRDIEAHQVQSPGEREASVCFSLAQINDWFIRG